MRIADMTGARGSFNFRYPSVTNPIWEQIRDRQQGFSGIFAWAPTEFNLAQGGEARFAKALWVSGEFFNVLGVQPVMGRVRPFMMRSSESAKGSAARVIPNKLTGTLSTPKLVATGAN